MVEESGVIGQERPRQWDYDRHFREYMLLLGKRGLEGVESIDRFPNRIALNAVWHTALDGMRAETKADGHERYSLITYDETAREFQFPEISAKGEPEEVPPEVINEEVRRARQEKKITSIVGDIHTHPIDTPFSTGDLSNLLNPKLNPHTLVSGVTTEHLNIFAFRTRETEMLGKFDVGSDAFQKFFSKHWAEKIGFRLSKDGSQIVGSGLLASQWKINFGIAERHRIALYRGKPKEDLVRIPTDKTPLWIWSDLLKEVLVG